MRVTVDHDICEANAVCEGIDPEVFHVTDDDELQILMVQPGEAHEANVIEAARRCPKAALTIHQD